MSTRKHLRQQGQAGKRRGSQFAANRQPGRVIAGKIAMLRALLESRDGTATIDDATADLAEPFDDGGKWRGSVTQSLSMAGIIEGNGVEKSDRPSRHRGYVTRWRLVNRRKGGLLLAQLVAVIANVRVAAEMHDTSPVNKETAPGQVVRDSPGTASEQKTFPTFDQRQNGEKGVSHGHTD